MSISGALKDQAFCLPGPSLCAINSPPGPDYTNDITSGDIPVVFLHGTADLVIPYVNAKRASERANSTGVRSKLITLHGAGHVPMHQCFDSQKPYLNEWLTFMSGALNLAQAECPTAPGHL